MPLNFTLENGRLKLTYSSLGRKENETHGKKYHVVSTDTYRILETTRNMNKLNPRELAMFPGKYPDRRSGNVTRAYTCIMG